MGQGGSRGSHQQRNGVALHQPDINRPLWKEGFKKAGELVQASRHDILMVKGVEAKVCACPWTAKLYLKRGDGWGLCTSMDAKNRHEEKGGFSTLFTTVTRHPHSPPSDTAIANKASNPTPAQAHAIPPGALLVRLT